jgi:hypothetical protein
MGIKQLLQKMLPHGGKGSKPAELPAYHAVTVTAPIECCAAARATIEHPILSRAKPRLPLPGCTMPEECTCRFRKRNDRRSGERRFFGAGAQTQWSLKEGNKRLRTDRRTGKK